MDTKDFIIAGLGLWIWSLLHKQTNTSLQQVELANGAIIDVDGTGSKRYVATITSQSPIQSIYVPGSKGDGTITVGVQGKVQDDYVPAWSEIKGFKNPIKKCGIPNCV
jgi:hypothetical protein